MRRPRVQQRRNSVHGCRDDLIAFEVQGTESAALKLLRRTLQGRLEGFQGSSAAP